MTERSPVVIVGAGVAGLYAAWSLLERGVPLRPGGARPEVLVVEAGNRVGGRLLSVAPPGATERRAELGAMHYYASQAIVDRLVAELGLESRRFAGGAMSDPADLYYLRGSRLGRDALAVGGTDLPYALAAGEIGLPLPQIVRDAVGPAMAAVAGRTPAERRAMSEGFLLDGRPLSEMSWRELLGSGLSPEAERLMVDANGHHGMTAPGVGAATMFLTDAPERGGERTLGAGMQSLAESLADRVRAMGGCIETGVRALAVADGPAVVLERGGRTETVRAEAVVLALPRRALAAMDLTTGPLAGSTLAEDLDAVVPIPALKVILAFERPWWNDLGIRSGKSVTDLPMRECVYFDAPPIGLMAACYVDFDAVPYWEALEGASAPGDPASPAVLRATLTQLEAVHGVPVPAPIWSAVSDWGADPFGAGWHYWRQGVRPLAVAERVRAPAPGVAVHVCGEAWSTAQGWIMGSLQTAERVLQDHLGQPAPGWLGDADLGG